ncbi:helix-turn-helix transcriptional regulator [Liquorilactobacillus nagelii]|jgi:transcriptional regulator with XRE-family HTH domain|uniref:helix-turn-helix transcriptional regulator n=1 Tax=Liquorilactobacillus nagelii TaxID=82688 RepID=UPI0039E85D6E
MQINIKLSLTAARVNSGYTLKEAAAMMGVHYQTLSSWEKDSTKLTFEEADKLSKLYHIPSGLIFFGNRNEFIRSLRKEPVNE